MNTPCFGDARPCPAAATLQYAAGPPRQRVLLVDQSTDAREMYAEWFRTRGYCTLQAASAADGLRLASELQPVAAIVTVGPLESSAAAALVRLLKSGDITPRPYVVALTSFALDPARHLHLLRHCDRVLPLPCPPDVLSNAVEHLAGARVERHQHVLRHSRSIHVRPRPVVRGDF